MISATALTMGDRKTASLARIGQGEHTFLQIFGHDPRTMAKAAEILLSGSFDGCQFDEYPAGIDINMGCPVRKIYTSGDGSRLLENLPLAREITKRTAEVCRRFGVPLSVKIRLGTDSRHIVAPEFARALAESGAEKITLHCRTKEQMYAPSADPRYCLAAKSALVNEDHAIAFPVKPEPEKSIAIAKVGSFNDGRDSSTLDDKSASSYCFMASSSSRVALCGNGDVTDSDSALAYVGFGCGEVAVGRAALGQPWIFREIKDPGCPKMSAEEAIDAAKEFVYEVAAEKGEAVGIRESRSRAAHFIKGMPGSAKVRDRLNHAETVREFSEILDELKF